MEEISIRGGGAQSAAVGKRTRVTRSTTKERTQGHMRKGEGVSVRAWNLERWEAGRGSHHRTVRGMGGYKGRLLRLTVPKAKGLLIGEKRERDGQQVRTEEEGWSSDRLCQKGWGNAHARKGEMGRECEGGDHL